MEQNPLPTQREKKGAKCPIQRSRPQAPNPNRSHFMRTPVIPIEILRTRLSEACFFEATPNPKPKEVDKVESDIVPQIDMKWEDGADSNLSKTEDVDLDFKATAVAKDDEEKTLVIFRSSVHDIARAKEAISAGKKMPETPTVAPGHIEAPTVASDQIEEEPTPPTLFTKALELTPKELEHLELRHNPNLCTRPVIRQSQEEYKKNVTGFLEAERERKRRRRQGKPQRDHQTG